MIEPSVSKSREIMPGIVLYPQIANTPLGPVEHELTEEDGPTVMSIHV
jgi:hypothetical protein